MNYVQGKLMDIKDYCSINFFKKNTNNKINRNIKNININESYKNNV